MITSEDFNADNYYNFDSVDCDMKSLIHAIALHGNDLVGVELGVYRAESFCTILQMCTNIKKLYGIDSWKPYDDYLIEEQANNIIPVDRVTQRDVELNKFMALHSLKYHYFADKAEILEEDSSEAVKRFDDNSIDFIFIDTYLTKEQAVKDLHEWYPKLKNNGLFMGHDWNSLAIQEAVLEFRQEFNITYPLSVYDKCWAWKK